MKSKKQRWEINTEQPYYISPDESMRGIVRYMLNASDEIFEDIMESLMDLAEIRAKIIMDSMDIFEDANWCPPRPGSE